MQQATTKFSTALLLLILIFCHTSHAQSWQSVGDIGTNVQVENVTAMTVYDNQLVVAGIFSQAGGIPVNNIARFDGTSWHALGSGIHPDHTYTVWCMAVYNGELYAAGKFDSAGGIAVNNIAKWNGTSWSAVGNGVTGDQAEIMDMAVYNGKLYAGGYFLDTIGNASVWNLKYWNGTSWGFDSTIYTTSISPYQNYGSQGYGVMDGVNALEVFNGKLYIGGRFEGITQIGLAARSILSWDVNGLWPVFDTLGGLNNFAGITGNHNNGEPISSLATYGGYLYAGGDFDTAGHVLSHNIAKYDGYVWKATPNGCGQSCIGNLPLFSYSHGILTSGYVGSGIGVRTFDGTSWSTIPGEFDGIFTSFASYCEYQGNLYVGGQFSSAGGTNMINLAKWTGSVGIAAVEDDKQITLYPNPAQDRVTISFDHPFTGTVTINDVTGNEVMSQTIENSVSQVINMSQLQTGMYIVTVKNPGLTHYGKIVKE